MHSLLVVLVALFLLPGRSASTLAQDAAPASAPAAATMKAVRIHAFGGPEVLVLEDAPKPAPRKGQLLVRVHAAGVNPIDWKIRSGAFGRGKLPQPRVLGFDVAGVVEALGEGVESFHVGDAVYAYVSPLRNGAYAEYVIVDAQEAAPKPARLDHVHAAAVPLASLTAWQALVDSAQLAAGQTVLIHAGAGGVGHFAIQIAKARGAKVIATASQSNLEFLKQLGADVAVDYKAERFEDAAKDVDVVLDSIGGDTLARSYGCVKKGGIIVSIVGVPDAAKTKELGIRGALWLAKPSGAELAQVSKLIEDGKLAPTVSQVFTLADAAKAHAASEAGHTRGKLVLKVD